MAARASRISLSGVPGFTCSVRQPVDLGVAAVGDHDALIGVEEAQALRHVVDGRVEAGILAASSVSRCFKSWFCCSSCAVSFSRSVMS